ncbi:hypothetical protein DSL64_10400 [Dyadobacter luteus]|jgi:hypothetical protein|uniref:Addiction module component CHP02574 family protein n=1 Tax=Dyadobacter luteus TaxID=2259619 RepID=A0A3D8YFL0_9BACT|nr:hypothetical protein [Dyadobacter luteus]REA62059.1 hypothetical protein DSL64_10400 [Dyadobacter luteus]
MKLQYIADSKGITTGVYIPIAEWEEMKIRFEGIEAEETDNIPQWHKDVVMARLKESGEKSESVLDFDIAMDDLERSI